MTARIILTLLALAASTNANTFARDTPWNQRSTRSSGESLHATPPHIQLHKSTQPTKIVPPPKETPVVPPFTFWYNTTSDVPFTWIGPQYYAIPVFRGGKWYWPWGTPAPTPREEYILWGVDIPWPPRHPSNTTISTGVTKPPRGSSNFTAGAIGKPKVGKAVTPVSISTSVETVYYTTTVVMRGRPASVKTSAAITHTFAIGPVTTTTVATRRCMVMAGSDGRMMTTERYVGTVVEMQTYRVFMGVTTVPGRGAPVTFVAGELVRPEATDTAPTVISPTFALSATPTTTVVGDGGSGGESGERDGDGTAATSTPAVANASPERSMQTLYTPALLAVPTVAAGSDATAAGRNVTQTGGSTGMAIPRLQEGEGTMMRTDCLLAAAVAGLCLFLAAL
ncbi:hypothetical protein TWF696_003475 [Orbilia brochopaga]|uniref:Uncharacterized protein n=1 Tax=Orbilia brochopaga TaxID=3140254 RepID=A0AAV9TWL9_9PEZI